jgi:hypothetical protein
MRCIIFAIIIVLSGQLHADSPARQTARVTASNLGSAYFVMAPKKQHLLNGVLKLKGDAHGKAFKLNEAGGSKLLWEVSGWYAFSVFISDDGKYLVRMGNWAQGIAPSEEDLAVSFYKEGVEIRRYSTKELVKNPADVKRTTSHYFWQAEELDLPMLNWNNEFRVKTIDGYLYVFDIESGNLISSDKQ